MATVQVPSVGRIVHYVLNQPHVAEHRPAVVVHVWGPANPNSSIQLQVFCDGDGSSYNDRLPNVVWRTSVTHDEDDKRPGTWHWPEYVPAVEDWPEPVPPVEEG